MFLQEGLTTFSLQELLTFLYHLKRHILPCRTSSSGRRTSSAKTSGRKRVHKRNRVQSTKGLGLSYSSRCIFRYILRYTIIKTLVYTVENDHIIIASLIGLLTSWKIYTTNLLCTNKYENTTMTKRWSLARGMLGKVTPAYTANSPWSRSCM